MPFWQHPTMQVKPDQQVASLSAENESPEVEQLKQLFWEELFAALEELPEKQKSAFVKNELEDKTLQEIADEEGENLKTIISRKRYAVLHLRDRLEYLYDEFLMD